MIFTIVTVVWHIWHAKPQRFNRPLILVELPHPSSVTAINCVPLKRTARFIASNVSTIRFGVLGIVELKVVVVNSVLFRQCQRLVTNISIIFS